MDIIIIIVFFFTLQLYVIVIEIQLHNMLYVYYRVVTIIIHTDLSDVIDVLYSVL